ncbi:acetyltransferase [Candidatus Cyanaurora vandensis]|uniref:acetyltransferase n=1 Tax=Candidatus Cyanaurora vandensis TaxID=2714958 RepID=UPI00257D0682|nr:acetyltransferase [Candidatus Cyanaurora vandensis]
MLLLTHKPTGDLVEVVHLDELTNPLQGEILVRVQGGQEEQDPGPVPKAELGFPSGEDLPRCWLDVDYRGGGK